MTATLPIAFEDSGVHTLSLCLYRLHGRRVASSGVCIPKAGLVLGADSLSRAGLTLHIGALHVAPSHAVVRAVAGGWVLEPACRNMVLALNDEPIPWGDSRSLTPGDKIDMGFASLRVEDSLCDIPQPVEQAVAPSILEIADIQVVAEFPEFADDAVSSDPMPLTERTTPPACADEAGDPLAALAAESARVLAGKSLLAADGLLSLSAETTLTGRTEPHVLAGPAELPAPIPLPTVPMPPERPDDEDSDPLAHLPAAASLEEILEGPLSIDDVLDSLQRAHSATARSTVGNLPQEGNLPLVGNLPRGDDSIRMGAPLRRDDPSGGSNLPCGHDPLADLSAPDPVPDPLLLLAGVGAPPPREPELAPVLHREHRVTGITSPYRFTVTPDPEAPTEEDSWPHPIR